MMLSRIKQWINHSVPQLVPGIANAIVAFPLSIGLAIIAGVPPEVMILASIYAAFFNVIFAQSKYGVGGPNTAVALLTGAAIAPYAPPESHLYLGYVFALCVMVGVVQLLISFALRYMDIMDYVSNTVIDGLTMGIGAMFILSALNMAIGLAPDNANQWAIFNAFSSIVLAWEGDANSYAILVSTITLVCGLICWQFQRLSKYAIVIAVGVGIVVGNALDQRFETRLEMVGWIDLNLFVISMPDFRQVSWSTLFHLAGPAVAIALIGILQTLSIAKGIRDPGAPYDPVRESCSQAMQNFMMGFLYGTPVSNSYNKSALMQRLGGNKVSIITAAVFTGLIVIFFADVVAIIPMPALGASLILVGLSMLNPFKYKTHFTSGRLRAILVVVSAFTVVVLSIQAAIFLGALLSITSHFMKLSNPSVDIFYDNGTWVVRIKSAFFFVSGSKINKLVKKQLNQSQLSQGDKVRIDLTQAQIFTTDLIDIDWIHNLLGLDIVVTIVCQKSQESQINTLIDRGGIPANCQIEYVGQKLITIDQSKAA